MWEGNGDKCCLDKRKGAPSLSQAGGKAPLADTCLKPNWPLIELSVWKEPKSLLERAFFCKSLYPKWMLSSSRDDLCVGPVLVAVRENARTRERVC